ncbi:ABC transporter substrate-binding protein [Eleftheria terrae]|uniref:ABC transporter substrate-binding protein n=1 Tax=Eleftheria terrae TaxID=1597781 RepID=UPI00263AF6D3|nr:ABC transporter substrate-binding protein [Eleftheria terrae]WKB55473.1 ABC transporter substrate-binding protein [Eleftheria terrae]
MTSKFPVAARSLTRRQAITRIAAGAATVAVPAWAQTEGRIVLGQSAPMTGPNAQLGMEVRRGAQIYFNALNAAGGINGRLIELRTLDDGYDPQRCKANTQTLLNDDVFALFGYVGTPTSLAALPLAQERRIPFFAPVTGAPALRDNKARNVFHLRASYFDETALIVKQLTSVGLSRVAVFYQNDSYGLAGLEGVQRALKAKGLEPVATGTVERNTTDVSSAVKTIVAAKPDAIVQVGAYRSCAAFITSARQAGYGGTFYNVSFVGTQALADELGRKGHGVVVSQVMPFPFSTTTAISREYLQAVQRAGGNAQPNYSSIEGYIAAKVLAEGLRKAPKLTPDGLIAGLESVNTSFGGFSVSFSNAKHVGSTFVELSMLTEDGKVRR